MKLIAYLAVLLSVFLLSCSSTDEEPEGVEAQTPSSLGDEIEDEGLLTFEEAPDVESQSEEEWAQALAASWLGSSTNNGTQEQAECIGQGLVDQIGIARLLELGVRVEDVDAGMVSAGFTDDEAELIGEISAGCEG